MKKIIMLMVSGLFLPACVLAQTATVKHPEGKVVTYAEPEGAALSDQYTVTVLNSFTPLCRQ